ncbi:MAG: DUF4399 domain-containing protein [Xenococcus sp. (in: cyanobacteria)]
MKLKTIFSALLLVFSLSFLSLVPYAAAQEAISPAPANAKVYIIQPSDGENVPKTFTVKFGLSGMGVAPSGVDQENTGHHHLFVDVTDYPDFTSPLPTTDHILHFGGGQTETELTLTPGKHTLQLVLGNFAHIPHDKPVISEKITVYVE